MKERILGLFDLDQFDSEQSLFLKYYVSSSIKTIRWGFVLAAFLFAVFAILDVYMAPVAYHKLWLIRFVVVIPLFAIMLAVSFSKWFVRFSQPLMMGLFLIASLGIVMMIAVCQSDEPAYRFYYAGLILIVIGHHTIIKLAAQLSLLLSILVIIAYNIVAVQQEIKDAADLSILIGNNFFLISSVVLGEFAAKTNERLFKRDFLQKKELTESNAQLDESNAIKSRLLSIIAHDLRGPMANTKAILDLLNKEYISDAEFKQNVGKLSASVNNASSLLENLLSWSVFHIKNQEIIKENVSIKELTDNVFNLLRPQAERKSVRLINSIQNDQVVSAQPVLIETVIRNLVSNAIKFTEHGKVEVNSCVSDSVVRISVEDTGRGMPREVASNLFNWSLKKSLPGTQREKGTGIGLLICKEFVEKHNGHIFFNSQIGKGTTFYFTLGLN